MEKVECSACVPPFFVRIFLNGFSHTKVVIIKRRENHDKIRLFCCKLYLQ